ncbi:MAG: T9SS type A sorting domain-containing protein [Bacteroidota bacterium]|nr:T9SS type A sorting domain-containing protein [Bacteroidota bacterium]
MKKLIQTQNVEGACYANVFPTQSLLKQTKTLQSFIIFKKMFSLLAIILSFALPSKGQMIGWPTSTTNLTVSSGTTHYADAARANVSIISGSSPVVITFQNETSDFNSTNLTTSNPNNYLLIIQMEGPTAGRHERILINNINFTTKEIEVNVAALNHIYSTINKVQIVKVEIYDEVTLNDGGKITCSKYDRTNGHGGVLPMIMNLFTINGGAVDASGKGFDCNQTMGVAGTGAANNPWTVGAGSFGPVNTAPYHTFPTTPGTYGTGGQSGEAANNTGSSGTNSSYTIPYAGTFVTPINPNILTLGKWGILNSTHKAGDGGGGGGEGGDGGESNSICSNGSGAPGQLGEDGQAGGDAGKAGAGGGIILFKIRDNLVNNAFLGIPRIYSNGENGWAGRAGKGGGATGGAGGLGSLGCCDAGALYYSGPNGGYGDPGIGAGGGSGGDGGGPGTIWFKFMGAVPPSVTPPLFRVWGGKGGKGGNGSVGIPTNTQFTSTFDEPCVTWSSGGTGSGDDTICNCEETFRIFREMNTVLSAINYNFGGTGNSAQWKQYNSVLYATENGINYKCPLQEKLDCKLIFDKFVGNVSFEPLTTEAIDLGSALSNSNWKWLSTPNDLELIEYHPSSTFDGYLEDLSSPDLEKCYEVGCYPTDLYGDVIGAISGPDGSDGSDAYNGTINTNGTDPTSNANAQGNAPVPNEETSIDENKLSTIKIYPNPVNDFINIDWTNAYQNISYTIMSVDGKVILSSNIINSGNLKTKINVSTLSEGIYFISFKLDGVTHQQVTFTKQ